MSEKMCVLHSGAVVVNVTVNGPGDAGSIRDAVTDAVVACIEEAVKSKSSVPPGPRFSIGDVVYLNSGSPGLTVSGVFGKTVQVEWLGDDGAPRTHEFNEAMLEP